MFLPAEKQFPSTKDTRVFCHPHRITASHPGEYYGITIFYRAWLTRGQLISGSEYQLIEVWSIAVNFFKR